MPALPNRTAHEQAIQAELSATFTNIRKQAVSNPQSINWTEAENKSQRDLSDELATVFLLALAGMHKTTGQDFNQYVALALATDYANQRAAQVVSDLYSDLRTKTNQAASKAASSVVDGIPPDEAKRRYEAEIDSILNPLRASTIAITETTAAISAGEYAVGKPNKDKWWMALILLYGLPNAYEAWRDGKPGQTVRDLIGWPRMPRRRDLNEPAPDNWPTPTPRREMPKTPEVPATEPTTTEPQTTPGNEPNQGEPATTGGNQTPSGEQPPTTTPETPSVLFPYWQTEADEKVCPICLPLDGQPESVYWLPFPGGPPAHPRCRCTLRWARFEAVE